MQATDFVAESDEEEQEMLEALALAEDHYNCTLPSIESTASSTEVVARASKQEQEQRAAGMTVREHCHQVANQTVGEQLQETGTTGTTEHTDDPVVTDKELGYTHDADDRQDKDDKDVLAVKTLVEVDSRTWPGINKLGGAGWIVRVYRESEPEAVFYDVRYVLGGFERHIESKWVHSSELLYQHSNREKVDRDYYHGTVKNRYFVD